MCPAYCALKISQQMLELVNNRPVSMVVSQHSASGSYIWIIVVGLEGKGVEYVKGAVSVR